MNLLRLFCEIVESEQEFSQFLVFLALEKLMINNGSNWSVTISWMLRVIALIF